MHLQRPAREVALRTLVPLSLALGACASHPAPAPPAVADPLRAPAPPRLPAGLTTCSLLGQVQGAQRCRLYSTASSGFVDAAPDPLTQRAYLYDRYLDLYSSPSGEVVERNLKVAIAPGDPESHWGDEALLADIDDYGDSALWTATAGISATLRYASTGSEADYARMERLVRSSLSQFEVTGIEGYLARFHFAGVPPGTQLRNGYAMTVRAPGVNDGNFDVDPALLSRLPTYYQTGIPAANGSTTPVLPTWIGNPSIDQYAGPTALYPLAWPLLRDAGLKQRLARNLSCFLKRLRIFRIVNLSGNPTLQQALAQYLSAGVLQQDPGEPDLTKIDEVWGFYLPQYNKLNAATYPKECPATLATTPDLVIDVTSAEWESQLLLLVQRLQGNGSDAIDLAYFPGVRAGDAILLRAQALEAAYMNNDSSYLDWRRDVLDLNSDAAAIETTAGALKLPKGCTTYFRQPNVSNSFYVSMLVDQDPLTRPAALDVWKRKWHDKENGGFDNPLLDVMVSGSTGEKTARVDALLSQLADFGGAPGHRDDPRRNYDVDNVVTTPPGISLAHPSEQELETCKAGVTLLGIHIAGPGADPDAWYAAPALPLADRAYGGWAWQDSAFTAVHHWGGNQGMKQYAGSDFTEPYWMARYHGLLPDPHVTLVWGPDN